MITLALIGKGRWGSKYLDEIKKISDAKIKYVVTRNYLELLRYKDIDGIIIASPDSTHSKIAKAFPDKYLLVEKPLALSLKDALEIKNNHIMVGHIYLYNLALLDKIRKAGKIKKLYFTIQNTQKEANTTPLWYLAPHGVSLCVYLFGEPEKVRVRESKENLFIDLGYSNSTCKIEVGWNYLIKKRQIIIQGEKNIIFDDSELQGVSPLENELRSFIEYIKGGDCPTKLNHAIEVERILDKVQHLLPKKYNEKYIKPKA
mgnify:CR=1 FL=1